MTAAYHKCANCYQDFADHNYIEGSIDRYACPYPRQEVCYGGFNGGDPRKFHPDYECSTPEEIANHKRACELANQLEAEGKPLDLECPSGWIYGDDGKPVAHVFRCPFGLGIATYEFETEFEPLDASDSEMESWK